MQGFWGMTALQKGASAPEFTWPSIIFFKSTTYKSPTNSNQSTKHLSGALRKLWNLYNFRFCVLMPRKLQYMEQIKCANPKLSKITMRGFILTKCQPPNDCWGVLPSSWKPKISWEVTMDCLRCAMHWWSQIKHTIKMTTSLLAKYQVDGEPKGGQEKRPLELFGKF